MNWEFRRDISKSTSNINIRKFLKQLDFKSNIWFDIIKRTNDQVFNNQKNNSNNKSNKRGCTDDFNQSSYNNVVFSSQYSSRSQNWISYQFQNSTYQYRQYFNSEQQQQNRFAQRALFSTKQSLQIIVENRNAFDSKKQSNQFQRNVEERDKGKDKIYMTDEMNEKQFTLNYENAVEDYNDNFDHSKKYYVDENVNQYWSFENDAQNNQYEKEFMTLYIQNLSQCRRCKMTFEFNNRLHKHFKESECLRKNFIIVYVIIKAAAKDLLKSFAKNIKLLKFFAKLKSFVKKFFAEKSSANNLFNITIIKKINMTDFCVM